MKSFKPKWAKTQKSKETLDLSDFYNDALWRHQSHYKRQLQPLCEACLADGGKVTRATMVHHIVPIREGGDMYALVNLMSICLPCHNRIHAFKPTP